jgi:hypothetical protein
VIALAATAHLVGGARPAPLSPGFVFASLLSVGACAVLSHREWTLGRLLACLAASQLAFHALLQVEHDASALHWAGPHAQGLASVHGGTAMGMPGDLVTTMPSSAPSMVAAHATAVLLSALLLRHGERLQMRVLELLASVVQGFAPAGRPRVPAVRAPRIGAGAGVIPRTQTWFVSRRRRGPPWAVDPTARSITPVSASLGSP